jgi:hypothetical protein
MGTHGYLASRLARISIPAAFGAVSLLMTHQAIAATYGPKSFYITGSFSFDVASPGELNDLTQGTANFPGLLGGRLQIERGLFTPDWSHWIEADFFTGSAEASGDAGAFSHSLSYWAVIPLGVNYWFLRSSYIDFAVSGGVGVGLAPSYSLTTTPPGGTATTQDFKGKLGPVAIARIEARFWLGNHFAATFASGLHYFSSPLTTDGPPAASTQGSLTSLSMIGGVTFAFGGV